MKAQHLKAITSGVKTRTEMQLTGDTQLIKVTEVDTGVVLWDDFNQEVEL